MRIKDDLVTLNLNKIPVQHSKPIVCQIFFGLMFAFSRGRHDTLSHCLMHYLMLCMYSLLLVDVIS